MVGPRTRCRLEREIYLIRIRFKADIWKGREEMSKRLKAECIRLEKKYFQDLTLTDKGIRSKFKHGWSIGVPVISIRDVSINLKDIVGPFEVEDGNAGNYDKNKNRIELKRLLVVRCAKERTRDILLHEMIHAYLDQIEKFRHGQSWRPEGQNIEQILLAHLVISLKERLGNDFDRVFTIISDSRFWVDGHSLLFVLKSLDIDLRSDYPLGSILGYDREECLSCDVADAVQMLDEREFK